MCDSLPPTYSVIKQLGLDYCNVTKYVYLIEAQNVRNFPYPVRRSVSVGLDSQIWYLFQPAPGSPFCPSREFGVSTASLPRPSAVGWGPCSCPEFAASGIPGTSCPPWWCTVYKPSCVSRNQSKAKSSADELNAWYVVCIMAYVVQCT